MVAELRLEMAWSPSYEPSKLESPGQARPVSVFILGRALASGLVPSNIRAGPGRFLFECSPGQAGPVLVFDFFPGWAGSCTSLQNKCRKSNLGRTCGRLGGRASLAGLVRHRASEQN